MTHHAHRPHLSLSFLALRCPCCPLTTSLRHTGVEASQRLRGIVYCLLKSFKLGTSHHLWVYPHSHLKADPQPAYLTPSQSHLLTPQPQASTHLSHTAEHRPQTPTANMPLFNISPTELTPRAHHSRKLSQMLCVFFSHYLKINQTGEFLFVFCCTSLFSLFVSAFAGLAGLPSSKII